MIQQNINLYSKITKPKSHSTILTWRQFLLGNAAFTSLMIIAYLIMQASVYFLYLDNKSKIQKEQTLQQEFLSLKNKFPELFFSKNVAKSLGALEKELSSGEKFLSDISTQVSISSYLTLLANTILPDIWLTEIKITEDGDLINLKGYSLSSSSIQQFMQVLVNQKSLSNHILSVNDVETKEVVEEEPTPTESKSTETKTANQQVELKQAKEKPIEFEIQMTKKQS